MANPVYPVNLTGGQWNLVATSVVTGIIHKKTECKYFQTYRSTGEDAPTEIEEGVRMFNSRIGSEVISSSEYIDVYVWPTIDAVIRVDI